MDTKLFKFLRYLLAYHPEEFGLVPNNNGFFKIKEIFQVLIFTKKFKKVRLETLKQVFSYYYRDFFEFLEDFNLVRAKELYFSPPIPINTRQIYNFTKLWTFVKPKVWLNASIHGTIKAPKDSYIKLFVSKDLAENWAKVKGGLLIEVFPKLLPQTEIMSFGDSIFLLKELPFSATKGPLIDQKFLRKYGPKQETPERKPPIVPLIPPPPEEPEEPPLPFRKITKGKKKEKPWKRYQKKKARER